MVIIVGGACSQKASRHAREDILKSKIQKVIRKLSAYRTFVSNALASIDMHYLRSAAAGH